MMLSMALSPTQQNEVTKLAVTLFGAAPGGYKAYLNGVYLEHGQNMGATALALGNEPVFAAMYSGTPAQNIDKILNNLSVNAISDGALKAIAVNYITDQVNSGANIAQLYAFALDYMENNSGFEEVLANINEKVTVANVFTDGVGKAVVDLEGLMAHIADVMPYTVDSETGEPNNLMMGAVIHSDGPAPSAARAEWLVNLEAETGANDSVMAALIATAITAATTADNAAKAAVIATDTTFESQAVEDALAAETATISARDAAAEATTALTSALEAAEADATVTVATVDALTDAVNLAQKAQDTAVFGATLAAEAAANPDALTFNLAAIGAKVTAVDTKATATTAAALDLTASLIPDSLLYKATLTVTFSEGGSSAEPLVNGFESLVVIPTVNYLGFKSDINQAIKTAINEDTILSSLLTVQDGASDTLIIQSWGVGVFAADDLALSIKPATLTDLSTAEQAGLNLAWQSLNDGLTVPALTQSDLDTAVANVLAGSGDGVIALEFAGNGSTVEQNNIIEVSAYDQVIVLSVQADSNETLVFDGVFGSNAVFNFNDGGAPLSGVDTLDFSAYLNNVVSVGGVASQAVTDQASIASTGALTVNANDFTMITATTFTATDTWVDMTGNDFLNAVQNNATGYASITSATLEAGVEANAVGTTSSSIVFVENTTNLGEYKVLALVSSNATTEFTEATLLGTIDFGGSINATTVTIA